MAVEYQNIVGGSRNGSKSILFNAIKLDPSDIHSHTKNSENPDQIEFHTVGVKD